MAGRDRTNSLGYTYLLGAGERPAIALGVTFAGRACFSANTLPNE